MNKDRCIILVDGSNFYFKLKDLKLHHLLGFDFSEFAKRLSRGSRIEQAIYFVGKVRTDGSQKTKQLQANQQKLFVK